MTQIVKAGGLDITKNEKGELLLRLTFRNVGAENSDQYSWMPHWETIRELILSAIVVESINNPAGKEVELFEGSLNLCLKIRNRLTNMLMGQFGIEG